MESSAIQRDWLLDHMQLGAMFYAAHDGTFRLVTDDGIFSYTTEQELQLVQALLAGNLIGLVANDSQDNRLPCYELTDAGRLYLANSAVPQPAATEEDESLARNQLIDGRPQYEIMFRQHTRDQAIIGIVRLPFIPREGESIRLTVLRKDGQHETESYHVRSVSYDCYVTYPANLHTHDVSVRSCERITVTVTPCLPILF